MHRQYLLETLSRYDLFWNHSERSALNGSATTVSDFRRFMETNSDCFKRTNLEGHLTGSAIIVDPSFQKTLFTLHKKLKMWLQLGGHADGDPHLEQVALREAEEESGLTTLELVPWQHKDVPLPIDLDIHRIPANAKDPTHFHFDVCYLVQLKKDEPLQISDESTDLRWFSFDDATALIQEESLRRHLRKALWIRDNMG